MKRLLLLLSVLVVIFIFFSSPLFASPPLIDYRIESVSALFSRFVIRFIGPFHGYVEIQPISGGGRDEILGGDADDYANGRDDEDTDMIGDDKRKGRLNSGLLPGSKYKNTGGIIAYSH